MKTSLLRFTFLLIILSLSNFVFSQQQLAQPYWQRTFGGFGDDFSVGFTKTFEKGFVLVGYSYQSLDGDMDTANISYSYYAWIVKLDSARNIIWQKPKSKSLAYDRSEYELF